MLSPHGRMSAFQRAQMYSLQDENIHNIAVRGVFDQAQDIVKAWPATWTSRPLPPGRRELHQLGAHRRPGGVLLPRLAARHVQGRRPGLVRRALGQLRQHRATSPAAWVAGAPPGAGHEREQRAGRVLPHRRLPPASGRADLRHVQPVHGHLARVQLRALRVRSGAATRPACRRCGPAWRATAFDLSALKSEFESRYGFVGRQHHADRLATIRSVYDESGVLVDPHTADGVKVAREFVEPGVPCWCWKPPCRPSSPRPSRKRGRPAPPPGNLADLESLPQRVEVMDCDAAAVRRYLEAHAKM